MSEKIVVTNRIHSEVLARLEQVGDVVVNTSTDPWSQQLLIEKISDATALMGFMTDCVDETLLQHAPKLKIVACALKGFDNFDVPACTERGIWVSIVPDLLTEPTAELAICLGITLGRYVLQGDHQMRTSPFNGWRSQLFGKGLHNSNVAILGLGMVGQAIAQRLSGFGCKTLKGVDPVNVVDGITSCGLEEALRTSDYIFVAIPLAHQSINMLSHAQLEQCQPGQLMINVGRGSVINEQAIADALEKGHLGGYAADVFSCEDWGLSDRPREIEPRLLSHPNTVFTPHLGSAVASVRLAIEHKAADNIIAVLKGQTPPNAINFLNPSQATPTQHAALPS